jgi:hypothetical protein
VDKKMKKYFKYLIGGLLTLLLCGITFYYGYSTASALSSSSFIKWATDVVGTKTGTTTTVVGFYGNYTATSSYITKIGGAVKDVVYTFQTKNASTSAALTVSILASNDDYCDTSTTTTIYDVVMVNQINWFDAASFIRNSAALTSLPSATTTISWQINGKVKEGRTLMLDNVLAQCLKLDVNGSSTEAWIQVRTR